MQNISVKQGVMMVALFLVGTSFLVAPGIQAGKDIWLAYLLGLAISTLLALMYGRMLNYMPGKDIYEILKSLMGRPLTVIVLAVMSIYFFQLYSYVIRHFGGFINSVGLPEAPQMVPALCMGVLTVFSVVLGIEVLGRWTEYFLIPVVVFILFTVIMLGKYMDLNNMRPVMENGFNPVIKGMWGLLALPFGEIVAFLFVLPPFKEKGDSYKVFILGELVASGLIILSTISDVLVLGVDSVRRLYYPTYSALSIIEIGEFIQRLDVVAASVFTVAIFLKAAVLLLAIVKCLGKIFSMDEPRILIIPVMAMAINYGQMAFPGNFLQYESISVYWPYYSSIYQLFIPILLFIFLEYKMAKRKKFRDALSTY